VSESTTDEAIILRANEHYCQRDVDKNGRANHEIPRDLRSQSGPACLESAKNHTGSVDRGAIQIDNMLLIMALRYLLSMTFDGSFN